MNYIKTYNDTVDANCDFLIPRTGIVKDKSNIYYNKSYSEIYSGSGTITTKKNESHTVTNNKLSPYKSFQYTITYNNFINISSIYSTIETALKSDSGYIGISINNGNIIGGYYYKHATPILLNIVFYSPILYIYYYRKEGSGQGASVTITQYIYTSNELNLNNNTNITFKIYA